MIVGQRIKARLPVIGISQAELARRVGMSQSGMVNLIAGRSRETTFLHKIARELGTSPAFLSGETEDPAADAPPPQPTPPTLVMLPVALPSERALARMFEGLLRVMPPEADLAEQARLLAKRLPIGLSQLRDLLPEVEAGGSPMERELAEALSIPDHEPRP